MTMDRKHWTTRLYIHGLDLIAVFTDIPQTRFRQQTNLCHFMRVILIWIPVIWMIRVSLAALVVYVLVIYPWRNFGSLYLNFWVLAVITAGLIWAVARIVGHLKWIGLEERPEPVPLKLVKEFIKAQKAKICPVVTIGDHSDV